MIIGAATGQEYVTRPSARLAHWRLDAAILALVAIVLRLPAFLAHRSLVFDDGVFASSALAMRAGEVPFRDIFSSQGPVFLPLVWVADLIGLRTMEAPRVLGVASAVLLTIAVYSGARRITARANALLAAGLVTTSGSILWVTGPVNADGPSLALSTLAVAIALRYRDEPRLRTAIGMGIAAGAAISIKALAVPAIVIAGLVILMSHGRVRDSAAAASTALSVYVLTALPFGVGTVWHQSFTYHQQSRRLTSYTAAARKVLGTLWDRDLLVLVALALALLAFAARCVMQYRTARRVGPTRIVEVAVLGLWVALVFALLVWEPALWRAHVAHLVPPLALLAALRPPPWAALAVAGIIVAPFAVSINQAILWPDGYSGQEAALVQHLEQFPADAQFISDEPGWVWRSGHRPPGAFADTSYQRIDNRDITEASLVKAAAAHEVCGVIASSPQRFRRFHRLRSALAREGYRATRYGRRITLYERRTGRCDALKSARAAIPKSGSRTRASMFALRVMRDVPHRSARGQLVCSLPVGGATVTGAGTGLPLR